MTAIVGVWSKAFPAVTLTCECGRMLLATDPLPTISLGRLNELVREHNRVCHPKWWQR